MSDFAFENGSALAALPETNQIAALLGAVRPVDSMPPLGARPVLQFFSGVNWRNREAPPTPAPVSLDSPQPRVLGALNLASFLAAVNWRNATRAPSLPLAGDNLDGPADYPFATDKILKEFVWD